MQIVKYDDKYKDDIMELIKNFYNDAVVKYDSGALENDVILNSIERCRDDSFCFIKDGHCQGVLAGFTVTNPYNSAKTFQEVIWYVNQEYRRFGVKLLKYAEKQLKKRGYKTIVMALLHSSMPAKVHDLYVRLGFKPFETHYLKGLS